MAAREVAERIVRGLVQARRRVPGDIRVRRGVLGHYSRGQTRARIGAESPAAGEVAQPRVVAVSRARNAARVGRADVGAVAAAAGPRAEIVVAPVVRNRREVGRDACCRRFCQHQDARSGALAPIYRAVSVLARPCAQVLKGGNAGACCAGIWGEG